MDDSRYLEELIAIANLLLAAEEAESSTLKAALRADANQRLERVAIEGAASAKLDHLAALRSIYAALRSERAAAADDLQNAVQKADVLSAENRRLLEQNAKLTVAHSEVENRRGPEGAEAAVPDAAPAKPGEDLDLVRDLDAVRLRVRRRRSALALEAVLGIYLVEGARAIQSSARPDFFAHVVEAINAGDLDGLERIVPVGASVRVADVRKAFAAAGADGWNAARAAVDAVVSNGISLTSAHFNGWKTDLPGLIASAPRVWVCSDVHLGVDAARADFFDEALALAEPGDTLILLGDILDFWIAAEPEQVTRRIDASWRWVFSRLRALLESGVEVRWLPGNHDPFVFTLYGSAAFEWGDDLRRRSRWFRRIQDGVGTSHSLLRAVTSIDYPFLAMDVGAERWLFTHGHTHEWYWSLFLSEPAASPTLALLASAPFQWSGLWLTTLANQFAYRYSNGLRRAFKLRDALGSPSRSLVDIGIAITHESLRSRDLVTAIRDGQWSTVHAEVEESFVIAQSDSSDGVAMRERVAASVMQIKGGNSHKHEAEMYASTRAWLASNWASRTFSVSQDKTSGEVTRTAKPVSELSPWDRVIFGHFHQPTADEGLTGRSIDVGAMVDGVTTMLQIVPASGWVGRPRGL